MDTNEPLAPLAGEPSLTLNNEAKAYLREAGKWASFLGILGFISCGILLI